MLADVVVAVLVVAVVGLVAGGWYYSNELLVYPDSDAPAIASQVALVEEQGVDAEAIAVDGPLGTYEGVAVAGGDTWVMVVHGRGGALVEGAPLAGALADDDRRVVFTSYRNDAYAPDDPDGTRRLVTASGRTCRRGSIVRRPTVPAPSCCTASRWGARS